MNTNLLTEQLKNKITRAMQNPYAWPEIDDRINKEHKVLSQYLYENLKKEEYKRQMDNLQSQVPSLIVNSLPELELVLKYLDLDEAIKTATLKDMDLKYSQAVIQGYQCRFSIWFYKPIQKPGISMYCATQIKISNNQPKKVKQ